MGANGDTTLHDEGIRVLILEDSEPDSVMVAEELRKNNILFTSIVVNREDEFKKSLAEFAPDIILSDFCLPSYDGFMALDAVRERDPVVPFIFVSGAIGEDLAIEALKRGATDCVNKSHIGKLSGTVRRAMNECEERRHRRRAEEALDRLRYRNSLILDSAGEGIMGVDTDLMITFINRSALTMLGYGIDNVYGESLGKILDGGTDILRGKLQKGDGADPAVKGKTVCAMDMMIHAYDKRVFPAECTLSPIFEKDTVTGYVFTMSDITERVKAKEEIERGYERLRKILLDSINAISLALELRDPYTAGHQRRVSDLAKAIAGAMGCTEDRITGIYLAGLAHDIGKIAVPAEILSKPSKLSDLEFDMIRVHPEAGYNILGSIDYPWPIADAVYQHHERLDGSGYPRGLSGDDIILEAKILAVADVVEAMASHRPYRAALGITPALAEIRKNAGKLYDPGIAETCLSLFQGGFAFA